eukprot:10982854-Prorocentrum_lima.AAC.1
MHLQFLMAEREKTGSVVDMASLKKYFQMLQQDCGMMRDVLEGTMPSAKKWERIWLTWRQP